MIAIERLGANAIKVTAPPKLQAGDFAQLAPDADRLIREYGGLRLLIDATALTGWEDPAAIERHAAFVKGHQQKVERIAVLAAHDWQHWLIGAVRVFLHPEIKVFAPGEEDQARHWLLDKE
jgi:hypothetical protein